MECGLGLWIGMSICLHRAFLYLTLSSDPPLPPPPDWLLERWPSRARSLRTASRSSRGKARSPPNHSQQAAELDKSEEVLVGPAQLRVWFIFPNSTMRARQCKPSPVSLKTLYILAETAELRGLLEHKHKIHDRRRAWKADRPGCAARCTRTQCSKTVFLAAMEAVIAAVCPACLEYEANFDSQPLFDYTM